MKNGVIKLEKTLLYIYIFNSHFVHCYRWRKNELLTVNLLTIGLSYALTINS